MKLTELQDKLKEYYDKNQGCWIGLHDPHYEDTSSKIEKNGLLVSHGPYGRKVRGFMDEKGEIVLDERNFKTTMYHSKTGDAPELMTLPQSLIVVNIPKEILELFGADSLNEASYQPFCIYGYQEEPIVIRDENGFFIGAKHGDIDPQTTIVDENGKRANVRVLPACFVAGHFNIETGEFVENDKHFSKLPIEEQKGLVEFFMQFIKTKHADLQND